MTVSAPFALAGLVAPSPSDFDFLLNPNNTRGESAVGTQKSLPYELSFIEDMLQSDPFREFKTWTVAGH